MISELVKRFMLRNLICTLFCLLYTLVGNAQEMKKGFYITGKVKVEQGLVDGTTIQIFRNDGLLNNVIVNRTGSFRIAVDLGCLYRFQFIKEEFYSKIIEFDTHVPDEVCKQNCLFPPYQMAVMLYKKVPGVAELKTDIARVSYNHQIDNFDAEQLREVSAKEDNADKILNEIKQKSIEYEQQAKKIKQDNYRQLINDAGVFERQNEWEKAMYRYRDALMIDPNQLVPRQKVQAMYQLLIADQLAVTLGLANSDNFLKYLNYGDSQFQKNEFTVAKVAYQKALTVYPDDEKLLLKLKTAKLDVDKLNELALDELKHDKVVYAARTEKYNDFIRNGDVKFKQKAYADAKDFYAQAVNQVKENSYALLMIQRIDELTGDSELALRLAQERDAADKKKLIDARNQAYRDAIAEADRLFDQRIYRDAIEAYELAITIKSYEFYPKSQIRIINEILADLQLKGEVYNRLLREADELLFKKNYQTARDLYVSAHALIPDEEYAQKKVIEIDKHLKNAGAEFEIEKKYNALLVEADVLFNKKIYNEALSAYQDALAVKPGEKYPREQIVMIREIMAREQNEQAMATQRKNEYDHTIMLADKAFQQNSYTTARTFYFEALQIIAGQEYPLTQIRRIDELIRQQKLSATKVTKLENIDFSNLQNVSEDDRMAAFAEAMELGASFTKSKEWGIARFYFRRALALIPNHKLASEKLSEVEKQIFGDNVNQATYNEMIKKADESFKTGDFGVAKFYYNKARDANPNDDYVNERIRVVTRLAESTAERESNKEYDAAIKKAKEALAVKNYAVARFFYRKALSLKQNDDTAKQGLLEVENLINN